MSKPRLAAIDRQLDGIEAPDTDDNAPALPIHAGAAAYLSGNLQSLSDQAQNALYWFGLVASSCVSIGAASLTIYRRVRPRRSPNRLMQLLKIWLIARSSDPNEKATLEHEIDELMHDAIVAEARGRAEATELRLAELVEAQARASLKGGSAKCSRLDLAPGQEGPHHAPVPGSPNDRKLIIRDPGSAIDASGCARS